MSGGHKLKSTEIGVETFGMASKGEYGAFRSKHCSAG